MISTSKADAFMDRLVTLVQSDFKTVKDIDVVMLLGPTGSGKSTLMCMIAGCKVTATYNRKRGIYQFKAEPQISTIGHNQSMTFIPRHWEGKSLRVYDTPGFKDSRSIQHQIVKSFFIKEIADSARSIKVIVVGDIHSMFSTRCGPFGESFKQMGQLIPNFNPACDCSLIVTKAQPRNEAIQVQQTFQDQLELTIPEQRIKLIYNPQVDGEYNYSYLNLDSIIKDTPSLSQKCNIPLSSEARLKLIEINQELNQSIERAAAAYSDAVRRYYLQVISSNTSINNESLKELYQNVVESEEALKLSNNPQQFITNINNLSLRIQQVGKMKFKFEEICEFINKKYNQMIYIKDKIDDFKFNMNYWVSNIHFQCRSFERSKNISNLKSTDTLQAYLRDNLRTDMSTDIKSQVHAYLNKVNSFPATYSGSKNISGSLTHSNTYYKEFKIPYVAQVEIDQSLSYSGTVKYQGSKQVEASINIQRCRCGTSTFGLCWVCNHDYFDLKKTVTAKYEGNVYYSGKVSYRNKERQVLYATFSEAIKQNVTKQYNETVPYSGIHTVNCTEHHVCSCEKLADIVIAAKEVVEQIAYYRQIAIVQRKELSKLRNIQQVADNQGQTEVGLLGQLNINGYQFTGSNMARSIIIQQIHDQLTTQHNFSEYYRGDTTYSISRTYSQTYRCQGTKICNQNLTHKAQVPYFGSVPYSSRQKTSGFITALSCYNKCSFCRNGSADFPYEKYYDVQGTQQYSGTVSYNRTFPHRHQLRYNEQVPYSGVITKQQRVPYDGYNPVKCDKSAIIGTGHHSCTSCSTWEKFVAGLKGLLSIQTTLIEEIQSNKREINELIERQQTENRRLEQELAATTVG